MRQPSCLEARFIALWNSLGGPELVAEYRFHERRRWRADFAHLPSRTLIEVEGGVWVGGRHNRASGFLADAEKYLEAVLGGWRVVRLVSPQINEENLVRIITAVEQEWRTIR